jgi:pyruvate/2-oxoglutarate/acetoin dehydrogenase E1 component
MTQRRYIDAIRGALHRELTDDPSVVLLGGDIALGGPFGATAGLADEFGLERVVNTPISEATVAGLATGAALTGSRPVLEIMFIDFVTLAMDQLVNHAAKLHYMSGGTLRVPLTVRALVGAGGGLGAHHSQSLEAWFLHVPGLQVVAPATPADAWGLLRSAIRDDNPVLVLEHRGLYWTTGEVAEDADPIPIGRAAIVRAGSDVTIVTASGMVRTALDAADQLVEQRVDAEVIDLRTLSPLDLSTVLESVGRTGQLVIAHEAVRAGGFGAELAAQVQEAAFYELKAPIGRVAAPFSPVPASLELERHFIPDATVITECVMRTLHQRPSSLVRSKRAGH